MLPCDLLAQVSGSFEQESRRPPGTQLRLRESTAGEVDLADSGPRPQGGPVVSTAQTFRSRPASRDMRQLRYAAGYPVVREMIRPTRLVGRMQPEASIVDRYFGNRSLPILRR